MSQQSRVHKTYCFPEISVNKYFIIYQESKKRENKVNFKQKYYKYFINFLKIAMAPPGLFFEGENSSGGLAWEKTRPRGMHARLENF